jgi:hypothetical protein
MFANLDSMKKIIYLTVMLTFCIGINGQTLLMQEKVSPDDFKKPSKGPNYRNFSHLYLSFGLYFPENAEFEVPTKMGSSTRFEIGWRYKLKITNWLAMGTGLNYANTIYDLKQITNKIIPNNIGHMKEKFRLNSIGSELYLRLNYGRRGNIIGRYIDIGAYASWIYLLKHMYLDKPDIQNNYRANSQRVILTGLDYFEPFKYGLKARLGSNRYAVFATYRLNELFTSSYRSEVGGYYLPKLNIGLELGILK